MESPFVRTSLVKVGVKAPHLLSKNNLLNGYDTITWIEDRKNLVGWTYSFDFKYVNHFKRLIAGTGNLPHSKIKYAYNVHQKVYIDKKEMLVSSANLVHPTIQNVSIVIRDPVLLNHMRIMFNRQWRIL